MTVQFPESNQCYVYYQDPDPDPVLDMIDNSQLLLDEYEKAMLKVVMDKTPTPLVRQTIIDELQQYPQEVNKMGPLALALAGMAIWKNREEVTPLFMQWLLKVSLKVYVKETEQGDKNIFVSLCCQQWKVLLQSNAMTEEEIEGNFWRIVSL